MYNVCLEKDPIGWIMVKWNTGGNKEEVIGWITTLYFNRLPDRIWRISIIESIIEEI